jgi:hypothetical protein
LVLTQRLHHGYSWSKGNSVCFTTEIKERNILDVVAVVMVVVVVVIAVVVVVVVVVAAAAALVGNG